MIVMILIYIKIDCLCNIHQQTFQQFEQNCDKFPDYIYIYIYVYAPSMLLDYLFFHTFSLVPTIIQ